MLAAPVTAQSHYNSGPRPIDLGRDMRPVLDLLNVAFGPIRDSHGRVSDRFSLSQSAPIARRLGMFSRGFVPGFVWEESGRIVGNITLLESPLHGRYLIANVAVHPTFRRRGIARALMHEALAHIESWHGHQVFLQVESDNSAALSLYHSLAFDEIGIVGRWHAAVNRLRPLSADLVSGAAPRSLRRGEWRAAHELDRIGFAPDLNWPAPPAPDYYKAGIWRWISDTLNGRRQQTWVIDDNDSHLSTPVGLVDLASEWGRPHQLRLCVAPSWRGKVEGALLDVVIRRLRRFRAGTAYLNLPSGNPKLDSMLESANFRLQRSLTVMRKNLSAK